MITLLTDFGAGSEYVGALHAVLAASCPGRDRVDLAHDIPPGDVRLGAITLARLAPLAPAAIHLAVVDPGVGGPRRAAVVGLAAGGALVGPDNGLLGPAAAALGAERAVALTLPEGAAATFHGRDLFAPAAARLAAGARMADLGTAFDPADLMSPELPPPGVGPDELSAPIVAIDRFGNVQMLARPADLAAAGFTLGDRIFAAVTDRPHPATVCRAFADAAPAGMLVYADSHGMVAVAVNGGSAARRIGAEVGQTLSLRRRLRP